jgi:peptidoglycan/LPS O-acetylase OafA/YrhL
VTTSSPRSLWRTGALAGVVASVATVAVTAVARALDVSVEASPGKSIPIPAFPVFTLFFTALGVLLAQAISRRARRPRRTFVVTTVALTALSFIPDALLSTDAASKVALVTSHLVAAAIVIPALAARLAEARTA